MSSKGRTFISDKRNKIYLFPKKALKQQVVTPCMAGVLNIDGIILEAALWDNKSKNGLVFYGGNIKDSNDNKRRLALFKSKKSSPKAPELFGKFYWDGVFYKAFLWKQTSEKCPEYFSGIVKVDIALKKS